MSVDAKRWEALEAHGVSVAHVEMRLRLLEMQRHGPWAWHSVHGTLTHCDVHLVFPSRRHEVARVGEAMGGLAEGP